MEAFCNKNIFQKKNNYLLTSNKVQLYFTENNSRYFICRAKRVKISNRSPEFLRRALKYVKLQKQHLNSKNKEKHYLHGHKMKLRVCTPSILPSIHFTDISGYVELKNSVEC